jgi:uncharacterized NAD-dependent epimerase/dehydratase family protein
MNEEVAAGPRRYAIIADGLLSQRTAKTAFGVLRYGRDQVVAVIDRGHAGKTMLDVAPALGSPAPVVASLDDALAFSPNALLIGVATAGGYSPPEFRPQILKAIDAGLEVVSGLHALLADDPEFVARARASGARLWDVRVPPSDLGVFDGRAYGVPQTVVLAVGSDCAVGKMSVMLEIERAANATGRNAEFVATGQTGILIAGKGIAVDRVISDFVAGAAERLVLEADPSVVTLVEGQGSIFHPAYAPVTFGLLLGAAPDLLVFCHDASRSSIDGFDVAIPALHVLIDAHEAYLRSIKPARCVAVALNTSKLDEADARAAIASAERDTGLPATDPVRYGAAPLWHAIANSTATTAKA